VISTLIPPTTVNYSRSVLLLFNLFIADSVRADYDDIVSFFNTLHGSGHAAQFPVSSGSLDDFESSFGPRNKSGSGNYD